MPMVLEPRDRRRLDVSGNQSRELRTQDRPIAFNPLADAPRALGGVAVVTGGGFGRHRQFRLPPQPRVPLSDVAAPVLDRQRGRGTASVENRLLIAVGGRQQVDAIEAAFWQ